MKLAVSMQEAIQESEIELSQYLPWVRDAIMMPLRNMQEAIDNYELFNNELRFAIINKAQNRVVGAVGLMIRDKDVPYFEIGYWVRSSETGKGYITEAVQLGGTQDGHKDLGIMGDLTGFRINNGHCKASIINKQLFPGPMVLAHGTFLATTPLVVAVTVLGIAVGIQGMHLAVFFPELLFSDLFAFECLMHFTPIWINQPLATRQRGLWKQRMNQCGLRTVFWQGPVQI